MEGTTAPATAAPTATTPVQSQESTEETVQAAEAKRKLKIDDQEIDEEEVLKVYKERTGHQREANKKLQEGLKAKKQAEEFIQLMKDEGRLFEVIQKLGHNPRTLAEKYLAAQLEEEMLDPKEKEIKEYKSKLKTYEEMEKKQKEDAENKIKDELKAKYSKEFSDKFVDAIKGTNLPPTKRTVARMSEYIKTAAFDLKIEMTPEEAAKLVKEDLMLEKKHLLEEMSPEQLAEYLGEGGLQKVRTFDTSRLKDPNSNLKTPEAQGDIKPRQKSSDKRMSPQEWRRYNRGY